MTKDDGHHDATNPDDGPIEAPPDGAAPANEPGPAVIGLLLAASVFLLLLAALVLALFVNKELAIGVGVIGVLLFAGNPVVWAAILRAKERS